MTTKHEFPADLDNYIAGLRIENINLKLAAKQADALLKRATEICTFNTQDEVVVLDIEQFLASQQGEQCPQCDGSGKISGSDGCGVWYAVCQTCTKKHPEQAEGAQGERQAFEAEVLALGLPVERDHHGAYVSDHVRHLWSGWELRAALAQPSPAPDQSERNLDMGLDFEHLSRRMLEELARLGKCLVATADLERLTQERDAAQAKLAALEKQEPIGWWAQYCETPMRRMVHWGSNLPECATDTFYPFYSGPVALAGKVPEKPTEAMLQAGMNAMAEAQALRDQVKALQSDANSYQSGYDEGRRMGTKHRQSEVEQLTRDLEALRARVAVVPERIAADEPKEYWYRTGWNACLDELACLNGKAVSEGLLRRMLRDWEANDTVALWGDMEELQELLGEGKEVSDVLVRE